MKFLLSFVLGFVCVAHADCDKSIVTETKTLSTEVPSRLKGGYILVFDSQGTLQGEMPVETYKVVPRVHQQLVTKETVMCSSPAVAEKRKKNRVSLLAGQGPTGHLNSSSDGANAEVAEDISFVGSAQYQRDTGLKVFKVPVSVGIQLQTSETVLGIIGGDF